MQGNLQETLKSREQETSRAFSVKSQRGFKVKPQSCKLSQNGKKDRNALSSHTVTAGQRVVWHLPAGSTKRHFLKWTLLGCQWDASTSGSAFRLGIVERKIILRQAGQTSWRGWGRGQYSGEGSVFWGTTQWPTLFLFSGRSWDVDFIKDKIWPKVAMNYLLISMP